MVIEESKTEDLLAMSAMMLHFDSLASQTAVCEHFLKWAAWLAFSRVISREACKTTPGEEKLQINLDITLPSMPCEPGSLRRGGDKIAWLGVLRLLHGLRLLSFDAQDVMGSHEAGCLHSLFFHSKSIHERLWQALVTSVEGRCPWQPVQGEA